MLTDTHAHLHFDQFRDDLPEVIQRARETGVRRILTLG
ncbi:MAG TPA: hydrolase TatD, partial [Caldithrix sp.]|nr:hydrolase TatD [Caldithrix sp.]